MVSGEKIMKNLKKFIYPITFLIFSFVFYILLTSLLVEIPFPYGERRADGWANIFGLLWNVFITQIFCIIYGKIITKEKRKYLYVIYNSIVLLPFWAILFEWHIWGFVMLIIWTTACTFCASGPLKKRKDDNTEENDSTNLISKKNIIIAISSLTVIIALIVSSVFVFRHYYSTHYPYDDSFIIGSTEEEIIEKYGEFDRQSGSYKPDTVYSKSYLIHEPSGDLIFGSDYYTWYEIDFVNGTAQNVDLCVVDKAA